MAQMKFKVVKQNVTVHDRKDMYVAHPVYATKISTEELIHLAANDNQLSEATVAAAIYAFQKEMMQMLLNGHPIQFGVLGTFRLSASTKASEDNSRFSPDWVTRKRIIYTPSKDIKDKLDGVECVAAD